MIGYGVLIDRLCLAIVFLYSTVGKLWHWSPVSKKLGGTDCPGQLLSRAKSATVRFGYKDGPILSQARSRSKRPLSDQVADATKPRGQCRSWVESRPPNSKNGRRMIYATRLTLGAAAARVRTIVWCKSCQH
jgi:hypothetical protein